MIKKTTLIATKLFLALLVTSTMLNSGNAAAVAKTSTVASKVFDGSSYYIGGLNGELLYEYQSQLWKTDGTPSGTSMVSTAAPLKPYIKNSWPNESHHYPKGEVLNGVFFFAADDSIHGYELWRSDGTPTGTYMVKDINSGILGSYPEKFGASTNLIYFTTNDSCNNAQCELWRSDGTSDGTFLLTTLSLNVYFPYYYYSLLQPDDLIFQNGPDIWKSDGTLSGTALLTPAAELGQTDQNPIALYIASSDRHLWGTDANPGGEVSLTTFPATIPECIDGKCYFSNYTQSPNQDLWVTNGTPAGTIHLGSTAGTNLTLANVGENTYIAAGNAIWKTNDTPAGTELVIDNLYFPSNLISAYDTLFFVSGNQIWKSNGTSIGTVMIQDFGEKRVQIVKVNEKIFLKVYEPLSSPQYGEYFIPWHLYKITEDQSIFQLMDAEFFQYFFGCSSAMCYAGILDPNDSAVMAEKWFFESFDGPSNAPRTWVLTDVYFKDVALDHWAYAYVEKLANTGITAGCNLDQFCPDNSVTRAQMAVFVLKGKYGSSYNPPPVNSDSGFNDVAPEYWAAPWIKQLAAEGITSGCGNDNYCPENTVTRAQMALFLLKAKNGPSYSPPMVGSSTGFNDVEIDYWAAAFIKQLVADGITSGCGGGNYCPDNAVTRAQMAVFLVKAFNLP